MAKINTNYQKLAAGYLFPEIGRRVKLFSEQNPDAKIIRLGIGDVTQPLPSSVIKAGKAAFDEMGVQIKGYGQEKGYLFLREAIAQNEFEPRGVAIDPDDIFVSDGSKCDTGNIQEIFGQECRMAIQDPSYPVYVDTNVMAGRTGKANDHGQYEGLIYLPSTAENGFLADTPKEKADIIYLCFPNNPTGVIATKEELGKWVDYALKNESIILFDAAYVDFLRDDSLPHSIYEIDGAKKCAIEFRSFSKKAGFTGTRCAYTVVPKELMGKDEQGNPVSIKNLWSRRQSTKFNAVSYPIQKAAAACYTDQGKKEIKGLIDYYLANAKIIKEALVKLGFEVYGGVHSPYIWFKTPQGQDSWQFFDTLMTKAHVIGTPGSGFGPCGEGYFRLSAFGDRKEVEEAMKRISALGNHL